MGEIKLMPCPFCGGKARLFSHRAAEDAVAAGVECRDCGAATATFEDAYAPSEQAVFAWNRRAYFGNSYLNAQKGESRE